MMNHAGGGMWVWTVIGILEVVLLVVVIIKLPQKIIQHCHCRISIYGESGKTILVTLKSTTLLAMFKAPQLEEVAQQVENTIVKIMKEAAAA